MVQLSVSAHTRLLQAVVRQSHSFNDCVGASPAGEELAGGVRFEQEDPIPHLEFSWLSLAVVVGLLTTFFSICLRV